jgi:hypothetical protein
MMVVQPATVTTTIGPNSQILGRQSQDRPVGVQYNPALRIDEVISLAAVCGQFQSI